MAILKFKNENNEWEIVESPDTIKYIEQQLSEEQKVQARKNIGALSKEDHFKIFDDEIDLNQAFEPGLYLVHLNNATHKPDLSDIQLSTSYAFLKVSPYKSWYDEYTGNIVRDGIAQELTIFGGDYINDTDWFSYSCVYTRAVYEDPMESGYFMDDGWCKVGDSRINDTVNKLKSDLSSTYMEHYGYPLLIPSDDSLFIFDDGDGSSSTYTISAAFDSSNSTITDIVIPYEHNGKLVTDIGYAGFSNCTSLKNVILPNTITQIEDEAFIECSNLQSIILNNGALERIGYLAFYNCSNLKDISSLLNATSIYDGVFCGIGIKELDLTNYSKNFIYPNMFEGCHNLTTIKFPKSITAVYYYAFGDCPNLTTVYYEGTKEDWENIQIDNMENANDPLINANIIYNATFNEFKGNTKIDGYLEAKNFSYLGEVDFNQIFEPGIYTIELSACKNGPQFDSNEYSAILIVSPSDTWDEGEYDGIGDTNIISWQHRVLITNGWDDEMFGCQYTNDIEVFVTSGAQPASHWVKISDSRKLNNSDSDSDSTNSSTTENIFKNFNSGSDFNSFDTIIENGIYSGYIYKKHNVLGLPNDFFETDNDDEYSSQYTMMVTVDKTDPEYWSVTQVLWSYSWCSNPKYYYRFCDLHTDGSNYNYNWSPWTSPSNNIKLSNYYTKAEIDTKFDDLCNIGAETIVTSITNNHLVLEHNQDARLGTLSSLTLSLPSDIVDNYKSYLCFTSSSETMSLTSDSNIIWMGDDVNEYGEFTPNTDTMYEVSIRKINENSDGTPVIVARTGMTNINDSINSSGSIDLSNYYTKEETDEKLDNVYTKEEVDNLLIEKANAINQLSEEKADKEFVVSIFEQLKALIEAGKTDEVIAVLDEAIFDLAVLA